MRGQGVRRRRHRRGRGRHVRRLTGRAVLFDLDGVLVDSRHAFASSLNAALVAHGFQPRPEEALHRFIGPPLHQTIESLVGAESAAAVVDAYRAEYRATSAPRTRVFAGIPELLAALADRPLAVATSKPKALAEPLLQALGLRRWFEVVEGPSLQATLEPKAQTIERAVTALGAAEAVMVGDRHHDVEGARANGLRCIGVLWGIGSDDELRGAGANALVATPAELAQNLT